MNTPESGKKAHSFSDNCIYDTVNFTVQSVGAAALWGLGISYLTEVSSAGELEITYKPQNPVKVNNARVRLIGVSHYIKNFFENEHQIRQEISGSSIVILEYFPHDSNLSLPGQSRDRFNALDALTERTDGFFSALGGVCAEYSKDIYVVNPEIPLMQVMEVYTMLGLSTALVGGDANYARNKLLGRRVSRRHFLKMLGYGISGATIYSWYNDISNFQSGSDSPENVSLLRWSLLDYRDLVSAGRIINTINIDDLGVESDRYIPVFQGAGHSPGVLKYLENPDLADYKSYVYPHYQMLARPVNRYTYDKINNVWVLRNFR